MKDITLLKKDIGSGTYGFVSIIKDKNGEKKVAKIYYRDRGGIYSSLREIDIAFRIDRKNLLKGYEILTKKNNDELFGNNLTGILIDYYDGDLGRFYERFFNDYNDEISSSNDENEGTDSSTDSETDEDLKFLNDLIKKDKKTLIPKEKYVLEKIIFGSTLTECEKTLLRLQIAMKMIHQLSDSFCHLYENGYYHLDIKPENVLYKIKEKFETIDDIDFCLSDYGLCVPRNSLTENSQVASGSWEVGTYSFLPFEALGKNITIYPSSASWMIALTVIEVLTDFSHDRKKNDFKNEREEFDYYRNHCFEFKENVLSNLKSWYNIKEKDENTDILYDHLRKCISEMLTLQYSKRTSPFEILGKNIENIPFKTYKFNNKNKHIDLYFKTLIECYLDFDCEEIYLKEFCLAWFYVCRFIIKNRININMNYRMEIMKCLELSLIFYNSSDTKPNYLRPEKILVNFIKELDENIFVNPIFLLASSPKEIYDLFEILLNEPGKYMEISDNGFAELGKDEIKPKNILFDLKKLPSYKPIKEVEY